MVDLGFPQPLLRSQADRLWKMKPPAKAGKPVGNETVEVPTIQLTPIRPSVVESTSAIPSNALHLFCNQKSMQNDADLFGFHVGS